MASTLAHPCSGMTSGRYVAVRSRLGLEKRERVDGKEVEEERGEGVLDSEDGVETKGSVEG